MSSRLMLTPMGMIVVMFVMMLAMITLTLIIISIQNLDLKNFFVVFNQSIVENRRQNNMSAEFRELQLVEIQEQQNRTRDLMPQFMRSINDTRLIVDLMPELIEALDNVSVTTAYLSSNFGQGSDYLERENFQYSQANDTYKTLQEIKGLLNRTG